jgi:hypothetical protein
MNGAGCAGNILLNPHRSSVCDSDSLAEGAESPGGSVTVRTYGLMMKWENLALSSRTY